MQARDMKRVEDGKNRPSADAASRCPAHGGHAGDPKRETLRCEYIHQPKKLKQPVLHNSTHQSAQLDTELLCN